MGGQRVDPQVLRVDFRLALQHQVPTRRQKALRHFGAMLQEAQDGFWDAVACRTR